MTSSLTTVRILGGVAAFALAGCGGGGGDGTQVSEIPQFASLAEVASVGQSNTTRIGALGTTLQADVPQTGTATYRGTIALNDQGATAEATLGGGMVLDVDFANAANVTGAAGNFFDRSGRAVSGELTLTNAEYGPISTGAAIIGDLDGRISGITVGTETKAYDYDLEAGLLYFDTDGGALLGPVLGEATEVGNTANVRDISGAATLEE